jgi:hypothetical protein
VSSLRIENAVVKPEAHDRKWIRAYGADSIPLHVLIDRQGIVRNWHPGRMTEDELDAAIRITLAAK